jgi:hypothetical protein
MTSPIDFSRAVQARYHTAGPITEQDLMEGTIQIIRRAGHQVELKIGVDSDGSRAIAVTHVEPGGHIAFDLRYGSLSDAKSARDARLARCRRR